MNIKQLAERVKSIRNQKHNRTSSNKASVEEGREVSGQLGSFGGRHNPKKTLHKNSLGNVKERSAAQRTGNQRRSPSTYAEEATEIVKDKVKKNKKGEMTRGQTATGQKADTLDFTPTKTELTTNH